MSRIRTWTIAEKSTRRRLGLCRTPPSSVHEAHEACLCVWVGVSGCGSEDEEEEEEEEE